MIKNGIYFLHVKSIAPFFLMFCLYGAIFSDTGEWRDIGKPALAGAAVGISASTLFTLYAVAHKMNFKWFAYSPFVAGLACVSLPTLCLFVANPGIKKEFTSTKKNIQKVTALGSAFVCGVACAAILAKAKIGLADSFLAKIPWLSQSTFPIQTIQQEVMPFVWASLLVNACTGIIWADYY